MNQERLLKVIVSPHLSEKANDVAEKYRQIVFKVLLDATKPEIKAAVEQLFNVKVDAVRTTTVKGKRRRFGRFSGKQNDWKKAYVKLAEGYDIDFATVETKG